MKRIGIFLAFVGGVLLCTTLGTPAEPLGIFENHTDIGSTVPGEATFESATGEYRIKASGMNKYTEDAIHFVYSEVSGAFSLRAKIRAENLDGRSDVASAGLEIRESMTPDSVFYGAFLDVANECLSLWRNSPGGSFLAAGASASRAYDALEIVRRGDWLSTYRVRTSTGRRGLHDSRTVPLPDPAYVGLAVTSFDPGKYTVGYLSDVKLVRHPAWGKRILPDFTYTPGQPMEVSLQITGESAPITVVETPPADWLVNNVSAGGTIEAATVHWNLASFSGSEVLIYTVTPPEDASEKGVFSGMIAGLEIAGKTIISPNPVPGKQTEMYTGLDYDYLLYLPESYGESGQKWPLILFLHGAGEVGSQLSRVKANGPPMLVNASRYKEIVPEVFNFVVASPQSKSGGWSSSSLIEVLDELVSNYAIDENRVYLTGLSMGGFGSWTLAGAYPERFAAVVPICGGANDVNLARLIHTPIWVFHGDSDDTVPVEYSLAAVSLLTALGGNVRLTIYPGVGHDSWTRTYSNPELYSWFLQRRRESVCVQNWRFHQ